jgi:hypothetical protein
MSSWLAAAGAFFVAAGEVGDSAHADMTTAALTNNNILFI